MSNLRTRTLLWRFHGLGTFAAVLTLVFSLELLLAALFGFPNVEVMLDSLTVQEKRMLVAVAGPWVHQGWGHLGNNLVFLLVFGGYVEWQLESRDFWVSSAGIGYLASWLLLSLGGAGAVGASSVTHGLEMLAGFLGLIRFSEKVLDVESVSGSIGATLNLLPTIFGFGFIYFEVIEWLASPQDATLLIHVLGAFFGASVGVAFTLQGVGNWWRTRGEHTN